MRVGVTLCKTFDQSHYCHKTHFEVFKESIHKLWTHVLNFLSKRSYADTNAMVIRLVHPEMSFKRALKID